SQSSRERQLLIAGQIDTPEQQNAALIEQRTQLGCVLSTQEHLGVGQDFGSDAGFQLYGRQRHLPVLVQMFSVGTLWSRTGVGHAALPRMISEHPSQASRLPARGVRA